MNLLPEYHAQPYGRKFKAAFKLFEGTDWHVVPNSEPFDTASEAIEAAKEHVKSALNSRIRASKTSRPWPTVSVSRNGAAARRRKKH